MFQTYLSSSRCCRFWKSPFWIRLMGFLFRSRNFRLGRTLRASRGTDLEEDRSSSKNQPARGTRTPELHLSSPELQLHNKNQHTSIHLSSTWWRTGVHLSFSSPTKNQPRTRTPELHLVEDRIHPQLQLHNQEPTHIHSPELHLSST